MPMGGLKDARRIKGEAAEQALVREIESEIKLNPGLAAAGSTAEELATSHRIFGDYAARHREAGFPNEGGGLRQASDPTSIPLNQEAEAGDKWMRSALERRKQGKKPLALPRSASSESDYLIENLMHLNRGSSQHEMLRIMRALDQVRVPTKPLPRYRREPEPEGGLGGFPSGTMEAQSRE